MARDRPESNRSTKSPLIPSGGSKPRGDSAVGASSTSSSTARSPWSEGSWRGKANAVAGLARESISSKASLDKAPVADSSQKPNQPISQGLNTPSKSTPSLASTTQIYATSSNGRAAATTVSASEKLGKRDESQLRDLESTDGANEPATAGAAKENESSDVQQDERPVPASGWRGWWSRPKDEPAEEKAENAKAQESKGTDAATLAALEGHAGDTQQIPQDTKAGGVDGPAKQDDESRHASRSSWFGLLGSMAMSQPAGEPAPQAPKADLPEPSSSNYNATPEAPYPSKLPDRPASGSWAFWMRDAGPKSSTSQNATDKKDQVGELAVSGTDSQSKPQIASMSNETSEAASTASKKRERPQSDVPLASAKRKSLGSIISRDSDAPKSETSSDSEVPAAMQDSVLRTSIPDKTPPQKPKPSESKPKVAPNLVLPQFESMYPASRPLSYWSKIAWVIGRGQPEHAKHLRVSGTPHRIKRGLALGIHGLFPSPMLQKILGPPTGTSIKFAEGAADAIRTLTEERGYSCEIEKVALEGEGLIADRIDTLWKLLLNWIDHIRKADFIFVACHSQGVPVAISLVAKLLNFGCVQSSARIGICGMAGVNLGPFPSYQSRFLAGSAAELFSLSQGDSAASQAYASALALLVKSHVRVLYIGSIDDQLISMESSTFANVAHPYVARAVYVDGRTHAPDFLTRLVGFSLKLRNLGLSDHGLVRELSGPLAGSLYGGEGHSRIYEEQAVYALALRHALDTDSLDAAANPPLEVKPYEVAGGGSGGATGAAAAPNPYFLPWAMRGMLEEEYVRTELAAETEELLGLFDKWRPQSKVLKDVRFRLEAVKSKL